jgi:AraC family transcriptional regulator of adaptative response / DNA-3-methyladenine glycosylase II
MGIVDLDRESCYRAFLSRDPRFDGRFFVGVRTTRVYCRPVCPARMPREENVVFFRCAAAAEEGGFRPCRRCRPEAAPGTPAWNGSSTTVARALRLIADGGLDGQGVPDLAGRLGVGERHLRRLFARHLGASPLSVARTRRVHFARNLIDETDLPMGRVATCSGFTSIRQFNHDVRRTFGRSPTDLRRRSRSGEGERPGSVLSLRLPYRPPFEWEHFVRYLGPRALPGVEAIDAGLYRRTTHAGGGAGWVSVRPVPGANHLLLEVHAPDYQERLIDLVERARRVFDLRAEPARIAEDLSRDPRLAPLVAARPGLRVPGAWCAFELAVRAILGQQVSVGAATALAGRLIERFGEPLPGEPAGGLTHLFPGPETIADADLAGLGMPESRAEAIRALARACADCSLDLPGLRGHADAVAVLASLPGVGPWTAEYIALRALGEPDAFPADDLGLRKAVSDGGSPVPAAALEAMAEAWRPWRGYAAMHLWTSLPGLPARERRERHAIPDRRASVAPRAAGGGGW